MTIYTHSEQTEIIDRQQRQILELQNSVRLDAKERAEYVADILRLNDTLTLVCFQRDSLLRLAAQARSDTGKRL